MSEEKFPLFTYGDAAKIISVLKQAAKHKITSEDVPSLVKRIEAIAKVCDGVWVDYDVLNPRG